MRILLLIPVWFILAMVIPAVWALAAIYRTVRGSRLVICPETGLGTTIELDTTHAVAMRVLGNPVQRIRFCARWPEREACNRKCLRQFQPAA